MQINKGNINLKEQISCQSTTVLVEGDVIVSDSCPDVAEILCVDAKVRVGDTDYKNGKAAVSGVVEFSAIYVPDGKETELKCMTREFDFSTEFDIKSDRNVEVFALATTEHIGFTLVNSRKLSSKVMVAVKVCAYQEKCYEPVISLDGDEIEKTEKKYNIYMPISENSTQFFVNDLLQIPQEYPDIAEILKVDSWVTPGDVRIMNGKTMVQGELHLNTLYTAANDSGSVFSVHHNIPFTEIVEAPGADDECVVNVDFSVYKVLPGIKGDLNGDTKIISIESTICAYVRVSKTVTESIVDDCYFLNADTDAQYETMRICEYVTSEKTKITSSQIAQIPKNIKAKEIVSCSAKPILRETKWENGIAKLSGMLVTYLIYRDDADVLRCAVSESELTWEKAISAPCSVEGFWNLSELNAKEDNGSVQILAEIDLFMKAIKEKRVKILTDCAEKEDKTKKKTPAMIVYFAKTGESVWDIAKKYRTKSQLIKDANSLDTEKIESGRRLLIPMA